MNKLTKLMLASAMMITSGFAAESDGNLCNGEIIVEGTLQINEDVEVNGMLQATGTGVEIENNACLKFGELGNLSVIDGAVFENANGTIDWTAEPTLTNSSGTVKGGKWIINAVGDQNLKNLTWEDPHELEIHYNSVSYEEPKLDGEYLCGKKTGLELREAKDSGKLRCKLPDGGWKSCVMSMKGKEGTDGRISTDDLWESEEFNKASIKTSCDTLNLILKDYDAGVGLVLNGTSVNLSLTGSEDKTLTLKTNDANGVITFTGNNSEMCSMVQFDETVKKLVASGDNSLFKGLPEEMLDVSVEVSGENSIGMYKTVNMGSLKLEGDGKLTIPSGSTLVLGKSKNAED